MKTTVMRILLIIVFGIGCGLFFYGFTDLSSISQSFAPGMGPTGITGSGGFSWSEAGRYFVGVGAFLMGIPVAFRFTR